MKHHLHRRRQPKNNLFFMFIPGENRYICHICNNLFEYPNPLKIHLASKCNKLDSNHLWANLTKEFTQSQRPPSLSTSLSTSLSLSLFPPTLDNPFKLQLSDCRTLRTPTTRISPILREPLNTSASPINMSPTSSTGPSSTSSLPLSPTNSSTEISPVRSTVAPRNSAFRPYMNQTIEPPRPSSRNSHTSHMTHTSHTTHSSHTTHTSLTTHIPEPLNHGNYHRQPPPPPHHSDVHAAQMETFYSNIGKSKQGHLCVYCGKVYSRKYGLKIHIRTHTGYKPLKCKVCLRPFGDPSNLNKHVRLHADGDTPYRCEHCGKVLVRRRDLERHIRSRHQGNSTGHMSDTSSDGV